MKILRNDFIKIKHNKSKQEVTITILGPKTEHIGNIIFTDIEFDNLAHLIVDNSEEIFGEVCHLKEENTDNLDTKVTKLFIPGDTLL